MDGGSEPTRRSRNRRCDWSGRLPIVVELKAITGIEDAHLAIVRSYLKAVGKKHGLILNFGRVPLEIKRVLAP